MNTGHEDTRKKIRKELETARTQIHQLYQALSERDFQKQSLNPGWTNGEIMAHMVFGFIIVNVLLPLARFWGRLPKGSSKWFARLLNALTRPFNWFNMLGARGQGKVFTYQRVINVFDRTYVSLLRKLDSVKDDEWAHGMYYPTRWDPNFDDFMTLEKLFHYPVTHFNFHLEQIARE
jgi:hypothetical protein